VSFIYVFFFLFLGGGGGRLKDLDRTTDKSVKL